LYKLFSYIYPVNFKRNDKKEGVVIQDNEDILNIMDEVLVDEGFDVNITAL